ncbi:GntR family transcriptional regulator [Kitasatospora sp. NPDC127067]|uniref:GntR family transcriptional regulator n=1 Tax=Kitasatospora sp. NPDC127067 TaxID=3347126 RepID=UPI003667C3FC
MPERKTPKWRQLADDLRAKIKSGEFAKGSALPQIRELAEETGWHYETVRSAVRALESEGLVVAKKGKGTFVSSILDKIYRDSTSRYRKSSREENGARGAFGAEIQRLGMTPRSVPTISRGPAPADVAEILGVAATEAVLIRARVMYADDTVVQLATSYFPGDIAFGTVLEQEDTGTGGSISRLAEQGHAQVEITEDVEVRQPTDEEAEALDIPSDRTVFEITHIARTAEGRAVEVVRHVAPTTLWKLSYTWAVDAS